MSRKIWIIGLALIALAATAGLGVWNLSRQAPPPSLVGGPFQLVDQDGATVDERVLRGKWSAVFFGYTYCPDICPGTLQALTEASAKLGPKAKNLRIVFISVDPARDRPAVIKAWLNANGAPAGALGLTGSPTQASAAAKAYRVYVEKDGSEKGGGGEGYLVNHSTAVYLMDPKGRFDRVLPFNLPDEIARQTADAMRGG